MNISGPHRDITLVELARSARSTSGTDTDRSLRSGKVNHLLEDAQIRKFEGERVL
jgi:hypothetical protein